MRPAVLMALVAVLGCKKPSPEDEAAAERKRARGIVRDLLEAGRYLGAGKDVAVKTLPVAAEAEGPAFVWIDHVGLVTIEGGKAELVRYPEAEKRGFQTYVADMAIDSGNPVMLSDHGVFRIKAGVREALGKPESMLGLSRIAIAPDGTIWVASREEVARRVDGEWKREELEIKDLESIDFDGAGHVYVTGRNDVFVLDGNAWKPIVQTKAMTEANGRQPWWQQTLVSPSGELWVATCDQLMRIANGKITVQDLAEPGFSRGRFVGDRLVGISCSTNSLVSIAPDGTLTELSPSVRTVGYTRTVDGSGRIWLALRAEHVTVVDAKATTMWPAGSLPAISGDVSAIAVVGKGPRALPAPVSNVRATISGFVVENGAPVPHASIELCRTPLLPEPSPCAKDPSRLTGETDDKGAFHIRAPLRSLQVVAKAANGWYWLMNHECTGLDPGATCNIGTIELTKAMNPNALSTELHYVSNHDGD